MRETHQHQATGTLQLRLDSLKLPTQLQSTVEPALVTASGISHSYGQTQVLFDVSLEILRGEIVLITGPSGSGKTTLLTLIGALRSVQSGSLQVLNKEMAGLEEKGRVTLRRQLGFIFQGHNLFDSLTALQNVRLALELHSGNRRQNTKRAAETLSRLGLEDHLHKKPSALSGGQCQRVAIARALAHRPPLILADEPTAALDAGTGLQTIELLKDLARDHGTTTLLVTHDNRILKAADRIVNMVDGRIASDVAVSESLEICEFLARIPAFAGYTPGALAEIAEHMKPRPAVAGERVFNQGDQGTELFIVWRGSVRIVTGSDDQEVALLEAGSFFGETALVTRQPRNAGAVSVGDSMLLTLSKERFDAAMDREKTFRDQLRQIFYTRQ